MVFSFPQKCYSLTWCIKKITDQPCFNVIFYLLRSVARSLLFILWAVVFITKKNFYFITVLTLNANYLYYWQCNFKNVMLPEGYSKKQWKNNYTRRLFQFHLVALWIYKSHLLYGVLSALSIKCNALHHWKVQISYNKTYHAFRGRNIFKKQTLNCIFLK